MKIRFVFKSRYLKNPFNGDYLECFERVPCIGESVCFDKCNKYLVLDVITELEGWKPKYTVVLN